MKRIILFAVLLIFGLAGCQAVAQGLRDTGNAIDGGTDLRPVIQKQDSQVVGLLVTPTPEAGPAPKLEGATVPWLGWTDWLMGNLVVPDAIQIRPSKPYEATLEVSVDEVYQLKTDYDDSDPKTWVGGSHLYKYRIPNGFQAILLGTQGDTAVKLCLAPEKENSLLLWLKTQKGNGTSALVRFEVVSSFPEVSKLCP